PKIAPDRSSPSSVVKAIAKALDARDLATLARVRKGTATKPTLDQNDMFVQNRDFFSGGIRLGWWKKVLALVDLTKLASMTGERIEYRVDVGGNLGFYTLTFERGGDGWLLAL